MTEFSRGLKSNKIKWLATTLLGVALVSCSVDTNNSEPAPQLSQNYETPSPNPAPSEEIIVIPTTPESPTPQAKIEKPLDARCYDVGRVACIELEVSPGIRGTFYSLLDGEVIYSLPARAGSTNQTDGVTGINSPRCQTTIQSKNKVIYSNLFRYSVPMYDAMSIACKDEINDQQQHDGVFIHGSGEFSEMGYEAIGSDGKPKGSHGCINLIHDDANSGKAYNTFEKGDEVVIFDATTKQIAYY